MITVIITGEKKKKKKRNMNNDDDDDGWQKPIETGFVSMKNVKKYKK